MQIKNPDTWNPLFAPCFTPMEMLDKGVFMDCHYNVAIKGLPADWYKHKNVIPRDQVPNPKQNFYGVKSRQSLKVWQAGGWTTEKSPLGWWEWYAKYFFGRRLEKEDSWQIGRWRSFVARHMGQVRAGCKLDDKNCHTVQRQALLQWSWDSTKLFTEDQQRANLRRLGIKTEKSTVATETLSVLNSPWQNW